jgi:hypothetical protein
LPLAVPTPTTHPTPETALPEILRATERPDPCARRTPAADSNAIGERAGGEVQG